MSGESMAKIYSHSVSAFAKESLFYVELAGEYEKKQDYRVERDYYDSLLIMYIEDGSLTVETDGKASEVVAGECVFIDCRTPHCYYSKQPITFKWAHLQGSSVHAYSDLLGKRFGSPSVIHASSIILQEFKILMGRLRGESSFEHSMSVTVHRLLATISERISAQTKSTEQALVNAEAYLRQNFNLQISITDVASKVDMSVYHFTRQFHKQYGISPYEYLIMQRISNAKRLLLNSGMNTKQISEACGYNNSSTFIAAFKTRVGSTPSQFRTNVIENIGV